MKAVSLARATGCSASWSGCIAPPKTMIASYASGSPGAASPFGDDQRSSVVAALDDDSLEQPAAARDGRVVDDGEDAHRGDC